MGFVLLIVVGGILGWLSSIITRTDEPDGIARDVVLGVIGALVIGLVANTDSIFVGLTAEALLLSLVGAIAVLAIYNLAIKRVAR